MNPLIHIAFLIKRLGWREGLHYWWASRGQPGEFTCQPKGFPHALILRRGTSDAAVFGTIFFFREFEQQVSIRTNGVILDLGANIGASSVFYAHKYPGSRVIALEPEESNYLMLQRNVVAWPQITTLRAAIWTHSLGVELNPSLNGEWAFTVGEKPQADSEKITSYSMRQLFEHFQLDYIDLVKIDIEGAEKEIFAAEDLTWLDQVGHLLVELHDRQKAGCTQVFYQAISRYPFRQHLCGEKVLIEFEHRRRV